MNVNAWLERQFPNPPCWELVAAVYHEELALAVNDFKTVNASVRSIASAFRLAIHKNPDGFAQLAEPVDFCIVLLGKTQKLGLHHCGIFYDGRVLHGLDSGNQYDEMSVIGDTYELIEYWGKA